MDRLDGSTTLANGLRARVRLPHRSDAAPLRALLRDAGVEAGELAVARALHFDPQGRVAVVATTLVGREERVVGLGVIDRFADEPELVVADETLTPGVGAVLEDALRGHVRRSRRVA